MGVWVDTGGDPDQDVLGLARLPGQSVQKLYLIETVHDHPADGMLQRFR